MIEQEVEDIIVKHKLLEAALKGVTPYDIGHIPGRRPRRKSASYEKAEEILDQKPYLMFHLDPLERAALCPTLAKGVLRQSQIERGRGLYQLYGREYFSAMSRGDKVRMAEIRQAAEQSSHSLEPKRSYVSRLRDFMEQLLLGGKKALPTLGLSAMLIACNPAPNHTPESIPTPPKADPVTQQRAEAVASALPSFIMQVDHHLFKAENPGNITPNKFSARMRQASDTISQALVEHIANQSQPEKHPDMFQANISNEATSKTTAGLIKALLTPLGKNEEKMLQTAINFRDSRVLESNDPVARQIDNLSEYLKSSLVASQPQPNTQLTEIVDLKSVNATAERAAVVGANLATINIIALRAGREVARSVNISSLSPPSQSAVLLTTIFQAEKIANLLKADQNPRIYNQYINSAAGQTILYNAAFETARKYAQYEDADFGYDYPVSLTPAEFSTRVASLASINPKALEAMRSAASDEYGRIDIYKAFLIEKAARTTLSLGEPLTFNPLEYHRIIAQFLTTGFANGAAFEVITLNQLFQRDPVEGIADMSASQFIAEIKQILGVDERLIRAIESMDILKDPYMMKLTRRILETTVYKYKKSQLRDWELVAFIGSQTDKEFLNSGDQYRDLYDFLQKRGVVF